MIINNELIKEEALKQICQGLIKFSETSSGIQVGLLDMARIIIDDNVDLDDKAMASATMIDVLDLRVEEVPSE